MRLPENKSIDVDKQLRYEEVLKNIRKIVYSDGKLTSSLQKITPILCQHMQYTWLGFYMVKGDALSVEAFCGPAIHKNTSNPQGARNQVLANECTVIIEEVEQIPKYIPVSEHEKSEIAVPAFKSYEVALILNAGSNQINYFDETDRLNLQRLMHLLEEIL